jgi:hypothetical protein
MTSLILSGTSELIANAVSSTLTVAFLIYQFVLYGTLSPLNGADTSSSAGQCLANTTLKLLLANAILDSVLTSFTLLSFIGSCIKIVRGAAHKEGEEVTGSAAHFIYWIINCTTSCGRILISLASFGLLVAMSVFVWRDQCNILNADASTGFFFSKLQTFLIVYWVLSFSVGCFVGVCTGVGQFKARSYTKL